jgi:hypothetical protein
MPTDREVRMEICPSVKVVISYLLAAAPDEKGAFDDYPDSLAIACAMSFADTMPMVTVAENPFYR